MDQGRTVDIEEAASVVGVGELGEVLKNLETTLTTKERMVKSVDSDRPERSCDLLTINTGRMTT